MNSNGSGLENSETDVTFIAFDGMEFLQLGILSAVAVFHSYLFEFLLSVSRLSRASPIDTLRYLINITT